MSLKDRLHTLSCMLISESLQLNRTFVPIPWAYDAMKQLYNGKTINCGMMVSVDLFNQCPDSNRTNNFAVFPVRLSVNETKGNFKYSAGY